MTRQEVAAGAAVILLGTLNNLLGRIKAKPLGAYNTLASVANAIAYIAAYTSVLIWSRGLRVLRPQEIDFFKGQTTRDENSPLIEAIEADEDATPRRIRSERWSLVLCIGACDAVGSVMGLAAQAVISGPLYSLSLQSIVLFSALIGYFFLGARFSTLQISSIAIVLCGASVSVAGSSSLPSPPHDTTASFAVMPPTFPAVVPGAAYVSLSAMSTLPTAASFAIREFLMKDYVTADHRGQKLNIFVIGLVSSIASFALLPVILFGHAIINTQMNHSWVLDISQGAQCLLGVTPPGAAGCERWACCAHAPLAYSAYILINTLFNFSLLYLVRVSTALLTFLCVKAVLPLSLISYALIKLPLLSEDDAALTWSNVLGLLLIMIGLCVYQYARAQQ